MNQLAPRDRSRTLPEQRGRAESGHAPPPGNSCSVDERPATRYTKRGRPPNVLAPRVSLRTYATHSVPFVACPSEGSFSLTRQC